MINANDLNELRRMVTNSYDGDKGIISRVLRGITDLTNENARLKAEIQKLKAK